MADGNVFKITSIQIVNVYLGLSEVTAVAKGATITARYSETFA